MTSRLEAFGLGAAASCALALVVCFVAGLGVVSFLVSGVLLLCLLVTFVALTAKSYYRDMSSRELFMLPFVPFFLAPLWIAVIAHTYDWLKEAPLVQNGLVVGMGILQVGALLGYLRLAGIKTTKR